MEAPGEREKALATILDLVGDDVRPTLSPAECTQIKRISLELAAPSNTDAVMSFNLEFHSILTNPNAPKETILDCARRMFKLMNALTVELQSLKLRHDKAITFIVEEPIRRERVSLRRQCYMTPRTEGE